MAFPSQIDRYAQRAGVPPELAALLLVAVGILVIVFPALIAWFVGLLLIVLGVWWLLVVFQARQHAAPRAPPPYTPPPYSPPPGTP